MTVGNQAQSDEKNVKSIEKALNILLLFTPETPELSHTDIAKTMGWSTATTSRLLNTLQNKGFLIRYPSTGRYTLGGVLYFLGQIHLFWNGFGMKRRRRLISLSVKGSSGYVSRKQKEHKASASQRNQGPTSLCAMAQQEQFCSPFRSRKSWDSLWPQ